MMNDAIEYVPQTRLPLVITRIDEVDENAVTQVMPALDWKQDVKRRLNHCGLRSYRANVIATAVMLAGLVVAAFVELL